MVVYVYDTSKIKFISERVQISVIISNWIPNMRNKTASVGENGIEILKH